MEQYISGSGYHGFSTWNYLLSDGLLDVQKEAQAELDKILDGKLPSDIASLSYLSALEVYWYAAVSSKNAFLQAKCIQLF